MEPFPSVFFVLRMAAAAAAETGCREIEPEHLLMALLQYVDIDLRPLFQIVRDETLRQEIQAECGRMQQLLAQRGLDACELSYHLRLRVGGGTQGVSEPTVHRSTATKRIFSRAEERCRRQRLPLGAYELLEEILAEPTPLVKSALDSPRAKKSQTKPGQPAKSSKLAAGGSKVPELAQAADDLRRLLRSRVFGQDHAIEDLVEGLFAAELARDEVRKRPVGLFVFAGPPGVGKTFLASTAAEHLKKPFKRFDMSSYSGYEEASTLIGNQPVFRGSQPGTLTGFVKEHPEAVLLFDEIEKASPHAILYFLQVLDSARLDDRYTEESVDFGQAVVIFTTNAGRSLYENGTFGTRWHRRTILAALAAEKHPVSGAQAFPETICSRLATGYPIMFQRLGIGDLERIADAQLQESGARLAKKLGLTFSYSDEVPLCLLLREGGFTDARTICAQVDLFVKNELLGFCRMLRQDRLAESLDHTTEMRVEVEKSGGTTGQDICSAPWK